MGRGDLDGSAQPPPIEDQTIVVSIDAAPEITYTIDIDRHRQESHQDLMVSFRRASRGVEVPTSLPLTEKRRR